ncbi:HNH endonuclease [Falsihalocynthiibacter arcticus]|uniref:HNH endonuclease n=1 Tax=Falsihalocynthiibacter arcticus TaxID=1579316 RepID=UPI0030031202
MSRLKAMPARLGATAPRLGAPPSNARAQDRARDELKPWRKWYGLKRWKDLRLKILVRACGVCEQTGVALIGKAPDPNSPVIDHIVEHNGDAALFWDEGNLQAVSKVWHDTEKQKQERARHD